MPNANAVTSPSTGSNQRGPVLTQRSQRGPLRTNLENASDSNAGSNHPRSSLARQQASEGQKQSDRTDALWAEMQSTLEEVELSAVNGNHVFGPEHAKALEDLRVTQIALAQAWARSEADDVAEAADRDSKVVKNSGLLNTEGKGTSDGMDGKSNTNSGSGRPGSSAGQEKTPSKLEEETEADILLARKRREANDKYFQRVNGGVLEVVAKLEEVAKAMRAVEQESRDIWGDTDSPVTSAS